jgi:ABC-type transporter Mla subunit MlaD
MTYLFAMDENNSALRQKQIDRRMGYLIIAGILLIGLAVLSWGIFHFKNQAKIRVVSFYQTGNLKIDDPLYLLGIRVGNIKSIELREQNVLVFLNTYKPIAIHQGCHVDNIEIGFMGDRMLTMDFGDSAKPLIQEKDTLMGTFHPGLSEAVGMAWKLQGVVDSFIELSAALLHNGPLRASFVQQVNKIAAITDSMSMTLVTIITNVGNGLPASLDSLNRIIGSVARISHTADSLTQQQLSGLNKQIGLVGGGLTKLESMLDGLLAATEKFEGRQGVDDHNAIASFIAKIKVLRDAVQQVKEGFFKLSKLAIQ